MELIVTIPGHLRVLAQLVGPVIPGEVPGLQYWLSLRGHSALWQDAARTIRADTHGTMVGSADDASGRARHTLQTTPLFRPTLETNVRNGHPALRFNGVNQYLQSVLFNAALVQPSTIFAVCTTDVTGVVVDGGVGASNSLYAESALVKMNAGTPLPSAVGTGAQWHVFTGHFNGASSTLRRDGVSIATGNAGAQSMSRVTLGADVTFNAGYYMDGWIGEVLIYNPAPPDEARAEIEAMLMTEWAIP